MFEAIFESVRRKSPLVLSVTNSHRVQHHGTAQLPGPLSGGEHGRNGPLVQRADVEVQSAAGSRPWPPARARPGAWMRTPRTR